MLGEGIEVRGCFIHSPFLYFLWLLTISEYKSFQLFRFDSIYLRQFIRFFFLASAVGPSVISKFVCGLLSLLPGICNNGVDVRGLHCF